MAKSTKISILAAMFALAFGLCVFASMAFLRSNPPTVSYLSSQPAGQPVNLELQTVGTIGYGIHPSWVSYLTRSPHGQWVHTTLFQVPAHTRINVTIYQYDSGSPLRNQQIGQVTGTIGNRMTLNGKSVSVANSNVGNGVGHTFSMPELGINVPLVGNNGNANLCGEAPCSPSGKDKSPVNVIKFSFISPARAGSYRWQCFVPCGLGFLYGNGGPMGTIGYMSGFMEVVG